MGAARSSALLAFALAAGCSKTERLPISGTLEVSPLLDFGDSGVGLTFQRELELRNTADQTIIIESVELARDFSDHVRRFRLLATPNAIPARSTAMQRISFQAFGPMVEAGTTQFTLHTNIGAFPVTLRGRGVPAMSIDPERIDFGDVDPNRGAEASVLVTNHLDFALPLLAGDPPMGSIAGGEFQIITPIPERLEARRSMWVNVRYLPSLDNRARGPDYSEWTLSYCDEPDICGVRLSMTGQRVGIAAPCFTVAPPELDFAPAPVGTYVQGAVTVTNNCLRAMTVNDVLIDASGTGAFYGFGGYRTLSPGGSLEIIVEHAPFLLGPVRSEMLINTTDPNGPQLIVPLSGHGLESVVCNFSIQSAYLDFGSVEVMRTQTAAMVIENVGTAPCSLGGFSLRGPAARVFDIISAPQGSLPAGASAVLEISYRPTAQAIDEAEVTFNIAPVQFPNPFTTQVRGHGTVDTPVIFPNQVDFGSVKSGCVSGTRTVHVHNPRNTMLTIERVELSFGSSFDFWLQNVALPMAIAPRSRAELSLSYVPNNASADAGSLLIYETGQLEPHVVSLLGREGNRVEQRFTQTHGFIDVVFMLDTSGSMFEEQQALAQNMQTFTDVATANGPGSQITTVNVPSDPLLSSAFDVLRAPALLGVHAGILRPEATETAIIFISDEDDVSQGDVELFVEEAFLIQGVHNKSATSIHAIAGEAPQGCFGPGGNAQPGLRFIEAAELTGGAVHSICGDWSSMLASLGTEIFGKRSRFFLDDVPANGTLEVVVDGTPMPAESPTGETYWSYDAMLNALRFTSFATPDPGAEIVVSYVTTCR